MKNSILLIVAALLQTVLLNGQSLIKDINIGSGSSFPTNFVEFNNDLYFNARDSSGATSIYKYDGNLVSLVVPADTAAGLFPVPKIEFQGKLIFIYAVTSGSSEGLWEYDGTNAPTLIANLNPTGIDGSRFNNMIIFNNVLYFMGRDGTSGEELFKYDGINSPSLVVDLNSSATGNSSPRSLTIFKNQLYFSAFDGTKPSLYVTDGIGTPNIAVDNVFAVSYDKSYPIINGKMYILGSGATFNSGNGAIYEYDGINNPTLVVNVSNFGSNFRVESIEKSFFNTLYFYVIPGFGQLQQWQHNLTTSITKTIDSTVLSIGVTGVEYNGEVYFPKDDPTKGWELAKYDGSTVSILTDLNPNGDAVRNFNAIVFNNSLFFSGDNGVTGVELFKYPGNNVALSERHKIRFSIYPNPTKNVLNIVLLQGTQKANYSLQDNGGREVLKGTVENANAKINVANIKAGTYTLSVELTGQVYTQKVLLQ